MSTLTSWAEADAKYALSKLLQAWDDGAPVIVHEGPTHLAALSFEEENHVVAGDLVVDGDVANYDLDSGGFLVVLGSCRAKNVLSGGGQVVVTGDLVVSNAVLAFYNHGWLEVRGALQAALIAAEHETRVKGAVSGVTIDFGGLRVDGTFTPAVTREQATRGAKGVFVAEVLNSHGYVDGNAFSERALAGEPVLR